MSELPIDSGNWHKINGQWIEFFEDPYMTQESFQVKKHGAYNVTVDGFPRQGNRYLRRKILLSLPSAAVPYPLIHKQIVMEKAIEQKHFVFSTFRDPIDSISSYISEFIKQDHLNTILNSLNNCLYTKDDYFLIEKCFLFYIRMTNFIANNIDNIFVVPFDSILNDVDNSLSLKIASIFDDKDYVDPVSVEPHSSANSLLKEYLMSDKFIDIRIQAYESYDKVLALKNTYSNKFI